MKNVIHFSVLIFVNLYLKYRFCLAFYNAFKILVSIVYERYFSNLKKPNIKQNTK